MWSPCCIFRWLLCSVSHISRLPRDRPGRIKGNDYDLRELAGAFGDLGTLIPFVVGYITVARMDAAGILVAFGLFKIVGESAVAAGVRRIEALTGAAAEQHVAEEERVLGETAALLKAQPGEIGARVAQLLDERRRLERELAEQRRALAKTIKK